MSPRSKPNDVARERLRAAGLRATAPRVHVYSLLRDVGGHRSVDDMVALLAERGKRLPRMSVYNVVGDLEAAALIMCADVGPGRALYEACDTWHHHFVCRICGRVQDVPCIKGRKPCLEPPGEIRGTIDEAQVIFRGRCTACGQAQRQDATPQRTRNRSTTARRRSRTHSKTLKRTRVTQGEE